VAVSAYRPTSARVRHVKERREGERLALAQRDGGREPVGGVGRVQVPEKQDQVVVVLGAEGRTPGEQGRELGGEVALRRERQRAQDLAAVAAESCAGVDPGVGGTVRLVAVLADRAGVPDTAQVAAACVQLLAVAVVAQQVRARHERADAALGARAVHAGLVRLGGEVLDDEGGVAVVGALVRDVVGEALEQRGVMAVGAHQRVDVGEQLAAGRGEAGHGERGERAPQRDRQQVPAVDEFGLKDDHGGIGLGGPSGAGGGERNVHALPAAQQQPGKVVGGLHHQVPPP